MYIWYIYICIVVYIYIHPQKLVIICSLTNMTEYYTYIGLYGYDSLMDLPRKMQWLNNLVIFSASILRYPNFVLEMAGPTDSQGAHGSPNDAYHQGTIRHRCQTCRRLKGGQARKSSWTSLGEWIIIWRKKYGWAYHMDIPYVAEYAGFWVLGFYPTPKVKWLLMLPSGSLT